MLTLRYLIIVSIIYLCYVSHNLNQHGIFVIKDSVDKTTLEERTWEFSNSKKNIKLYTYKKPGTESTLLNSFNRFVCNYSLDEIHLCYITPELLGYTLVSTVTKTGSDEVHSRKMKEITREDLLKSQKYEDSAISYYHLIFKEHPVVRYYEDIDIPLNNFDENKVQMAVIYEYGNVDFAIYINLPLSNIENQGYIKVKLKKSKLKILKMQRHYYMIGFVINVNGYNYVRVYPPIKFQNPCEIVYYYRQEVALKIFYGKTNHFQLIMESTETLIVLDYDTVKNIVTYNNLIVEKIGYDRKKIHLTFTKEYAGVIYVQGEYTFNQESLFYETSRYTSNTGTTLEDKAYVEPTLKKFNFQEPHDKFPGLEALIFKTKVLPNNGEKTDYKSSKIINTPPAIPLTNGYQNGKNGYHSSDYLNGNHDSYPTESNPPSPKQNGYAHTSEMQELMDHSNDQTKIIQEIPSSAGREHSNMNNNMPRKGGSYSQEPRDEDENLNQAPKKNKQEFLPSHFHTYEDLHLIEDTQQRLKAILKFYKDRNLDILPQDQFDDIENIMKSTIKHPNKNMRNRKRTYTILIITLFLELIIILSILIFAYYKGIKAGHESAYLWIRRSWRSALF